MKQRKTNQAGRSMLEMLGVLAIVGILSVCGIFGYNKAVLKIKLNRQAEQYTQLITELYLMDLKSVKTPTTTGVASYTKLMINSGIVPKEMISKENWLIDAMGNDIGILNSTEHLDIRIFGRNHENLDYDSCVNILHVSQQISNILWQVQLHTQASTSSSLRHPFYGDKICRRGITCLKDLTPPQIIKTCNLCKEPENQPCNMTLFLWQK